MRRAVLGIDRVGSTRVVAQPFGLCLVHALIGVCVLFLFVCFFRFNQSLVDVQDTKVSSLSFVVFDCEHNCWPTLDCAVIGREVYRVARGTLVGSY